MNHTMSAQRSPEMEACIEACRECARICTETARHCLEMGGEHADARHIALLLDCAQICQTSADFMLRGSDLSPRVCAACAAVCAACAESCERFSDDAAMRACAEACRRCAESCRAMAAA